MTTQDWLNIWGLFLLIDNAINFVLICQLRRHVVELERKAQP